jgi:hypothetical protein
LYVPVLPVHASGKLLFSLCRTCAETVQFKMIRRSNFIDPRVGGKWVRRGEGFRGSWLGVTSGLLITMTNRVASIQKQHNTSPLDHTKQRDV